MGRKQQLWVCRGIWVPDASRARPTITATLRHWVLLGGYCWPNSSSLVVTASSLTRWFWLPRSRIKKVQLTLDVFEVLFLLWVLLLEKSLPSGFKRTCRVKWIVNGINMWCQMMSLRRIWGMLFSCIIKAVLVLLPKRRKKIPWAQLVDAWEAHWWQILG